MAAEGLAYWLPLAVAVTAVCSLINLTRVPPPARWFLALSITAAIASVWRRLVWLALYTGGPFAVLWLTTVFIAVSMAAVRLQRREAQRGNTGPLYIAIAIMVALVIDALLHAEW